MSLGEQIAGVEDARPCRVLGSLAGHPNTTIAASPNKLLSLAWSPDGTVLAAGGVDGAVRLWSLSG